MRSPRKMPQRAMVRIWVASLHQELQRCYDVGVSVLSGLYNALQGWMRTASTRRTVRRGKSPCGAFLDARLAQSTRAHQKSSTHERALSFCFGRKFSYCEGAVPCIRPCASCLKIRRSLRKKKKARQSSTDQRAILVGAAGFEPTASSSRTKRATNCAMPRKYRSFSAAVWLGMRESNSHK